MEQMVQKLDTDSASLNALKLSLSLGSLLVSSFLIGCAEQPKNLEVGKAYCTVIGESFEDPDENSCAEENGYFIYSEDGKLLRPNLYLRDMKTFSNTPYPDVFSIESYAIKNGKIYEDGSYEDGEGIKLKMKDGRLQAMIDEYPEYIWILPDTSHQAIKAEQLLRAIENYEPPVFEPNSVASLDVPLCLVQTQYRNGKQDEQSNSCDSNQLLILNKDGYVLEVDLDDYSEEEGFEWQVVSSVTNLLGTYVPTVMVDNYPSWSLNDAGFPVSSERQQQSRARPFSGQYVGPGGPDMGRYTDKVEFVPFEGDRASELKAAYADYISPMMSKHSFVVSRLPPGESNY